MRSSSIFAAVLVSALFVFACQKAAQSPGFVKYAKETDVPRVSVQDAKAEIDAGTAIMVDSRPAEAYRSEHVAGAINVPFGSPPEKFSELPQGKKIFIYCSWPNEHTSAGLAFQMNQSNIPATYALLGGNIAWKNAGYPMEKWANPWAPRDNLY